MSSVVETTHSLVAKIMRWIRTRQWYVLGDLTWASSELNRSIWWYHSQMMNQPWWFISAHCVRRYLLQLPSELISHGSWQSLSEPEVEVQCGNPILWPKDQYHGWRPCLTLEWVDRPNHDRMWSQYPLRPPVFVYVISSTGMLQAATSSDDLIEEISRHDFTGCQRGCNTLWIQMLSVKDSKGIYSIHLKRLMKSQIRSEQGLG